MLGLDTLSTDCYTNVMNTTTDRWGRFLGFITTHLHLTILVTIAAMVGLNVANANYPATTEIIVNVAMIAGVLGTLGFLIFRTRK